MVYALADCLRVELIRQAKIGIHFFLSVTGSGRDRKSFIFSRVEI